jgi:type IV pilus assembly protein PilC
MIYIARLARSLAVLYRNGVTIMNALKLCEGLVGSPLVALALQDTSKRVEAGESLSEAMRRHKIFPQLLMRMVVMGEKTGNLDSALDNVAEYYNLLIPRKIKKLFGIMEPAMILFLVGVVGMVALAVFLPILSLMDHIGK